MNITKKYVSMIGIAGLAAFALVSGFKHAAAQQKGPVVPQIIRNIDEPGFNPFQASQNILFTNFSGDATFTIPQNKVAVIEQVSASGALQSDALSQVAPSSRGAGRRSTTPRESR